MVEEYELKMKNEKLKMNGGIGIYGFTIDGLTISMDGVGNVETECSPG
jgi:hypothetical protein